MDMKHVCKKFCTDFKKQHATADCSQIIDIFFNLKYCN